MPDAMPMYAAARVERSRRRAHRAFGRRDWPKARRWSMSAYRTALRVQGKTKRYHKGEALHNAGTAALFLGDDAEAARLTVLALIEDAVSAAEDDPRQPLVELDSPAARHLVYVFGVPGVSVADACRAVRTMHAAGAHLANPVAALDDRRVARLLDVPASFGNKRIPGRYTSTWDERVFLGGYYGLLRDVLEPIRDVLKSLGMDGVIAADFVQYPEQDEDEHARMLLLDCSRAVIDITERGGEEEELALAPESMWLSGRVLAIYDETVPGAPRVSGGTLRGMTGSKIRRRNIPIRTYGGNTNAAAVVLDWLGVLPVPLSRVPGTPRGAVQGSNTRILPRPPGTHSA